MVKKGKINFDQTKLLIILMLILAAGISIYSPNFLTGRNIRNIFTQNAVTGILAVGMTLVMISGGIDLGVGNLVSFIGCLMALMLKNGMGEGPAMLLALLTATLCGIITGAIVSFTSAQPFIITLGMMNVYKALALITANGSDIPIGTQFQFLGKTYLYTILFPVWIFIVLFLLLYLILSRTSLGRTVYCIGSNPEAAYISGIAVKSQKILIYGLNGFITGFAALVLLSRLGSAGPTMGDNYEMQAISACAIGGVTLTGGVGSAAGVFLGVLFLGLVRNGLNMMGVPSFYQYLVNGVIIIIAVVFSNYAEQKKS